MIRRTIFEWKELRFGEDDDAIPEPAGTAIAAVAAVSPLAGTSGNGVIQYGRKGLRARGVVGIIAADGVTLEILPKIAMAEEQNEAGHGEIRRRLVHMLAVAHDLKIDTGKMTTLDWQRETLLEILIRIFAEKLVDTVRRGMPRRYVEHVEDLAVLRGRLDLGRQYSVLAAEPARLACRYDALTPDIALNQIMKAAVNRLAGIARAAANQRMLRELRFTYADIADVPVRSLRWDDVVIDRTNGRWRELLDLARLLLSERFQTSTAGAGAGFSLLFDMSALFEEYVARMLRRALVGSDLRVVSQGGRRYCLEAESGGQLFQTRPDILVKRGEDIIQVIDTKWKRLGSRLDDPKHGVAQGDVYQMMAYGQIYQCGRLTLLYPHHPSLDHEEGLQPAHRVVGSRHRLQTATVDVGRSDAMLERLRALVVDGTVVA
jgi:5-methylcytosine-specific restriction enzyme subunit McrC